MKAFSRSRLYVFMAGFLSGISLLIIIVLWLAFSAPSWLVVDDAAHKADVAVVLGGGGGSRLRKGLSIYDAGLVDRLLLVDTRKRAWKHIQDHLCTDCKTEGKDVVILDRSVSTITDAERVNQYCNENGVDSILVVTDPYHTKRASIVFNSQFSGSNVAVSVVSSGDYVGKLSPDEKWWRDDATLKVIWGETSRILVLFFRGWI